MRGSLRWIGLGLLLVLGWLIGGEYIRYTVTHPRHELNPSSLTGPLSYYYLDWRNDWPDEGSLREAAQSGVLRTRRAVSDDGTDLGFHPDPVGVIQASLCVYDQLLDRREPWKEQLLTDQLDWLMDSAVWLPDSSAVWPCYWEAAEQGLSDPWISALVQGQAISLFARAAKMFPEGSAEDSAEKSAENSSNESAGGRSIPYLDWARHASVSLRDPRSCLVSNEVGWFFEEYPTEPRTGVLNGCLFSWLGLWDLSRSTNDRVLEQECLALLDAIEIQMPIYTNSNWTFYDAYRQDSVSPVYQEIHAALAETIAELTGRSAWVSWAERWRGAADSRGELTRAFGRTVARELKEKVRRVPVPEQRECAELPPLRNG